MKLLYVMVHTLKINRIISALEVCRVCRAFAVSEVYDSDNQIQIQPNSMRGIKAIRIRKRFKWNKGVPNGFLYTLELEVNVVKLLGKADVTMVEMSPVNADEMYGRIDGYLKQIFQLDEQNSNSRTWTLADCHCGVDIRIPKQEVNKIIYIIRAMHRSLNLLNKSHCELPDYKNRLSGQEKWESLRFGNSLYTYNIYYKYQELINHGANVNDRQVQDAINIIRAEMQLNSKGVAKKIGSPQAFGLLEKPAVTNRLLTIVREDMQAFFGYGTYVSYTKAMELIHNTKYSNQEKEYLKVIYTAAYKEDFQPFVDALLKKAKDFQVDENVVKKHLKLALSQLEALGIAVGGLAETELLMIQADKVENINVYIDNMFKSIQNNDKKGVFSKIFPIENGKRMKCQPFLCNALGEGMRYQITGATTEIVEKKVFAFMKELLNENLKAVNTLEAQQKVLLQSKDEMERFTTVIESKTMLYKVFEFIEKLNELTKKGCV